MQIQFEKTKRFNSHQTELTAGPKTVINVNFALQSYKIKYKRLLILKEIVAIPAEILYYC